MSLYSDFYVPGTPQPLKRRLSFIFYPVDSSIHPNSHSHSISQHIHMNGNHINGNTKTKGFLNGRAISLNAENVDGHANGNSNLSRFDEDGGSNEDLCTSLRIFLRFGRLLGILPLEGLFSRNTRTEHLKVTRFGLASLSNKLVIVVLSVNACIGMLNMFVSKKETASELAFSCAMAFFYFMGSFTYAYFGRHASDLIQLLKMWKHMKRLYFSSHPVYVTDSALFRDTNLVAGVIFTSAILENMLLFCLQAEIISFPYEKRTPAPLMDVYYHKSHVEWTRVAHNQTNTAPAVYLGYLVFFSNKLALYAWNYADTAIIIFSRALYYKFDILNKVAESQLLQSSSSGGDVSTSIIYSTIPQWKQLTIDHSTLCQLLGEFEEFLSPLVFTCFATNTFFICLQIKLGLSSTLNTNFISSLYYVWSLLHLLARVYLVSLSASRINDYAHGVRKLYQVCPTNAYTLEVQRADHYLSSSRIGLSGLGCFVITKPFILTVVGVVFTLEIVLLQTIQ